MGIGVHSTPALVRDPQIPSLGSPHLWGGGNNSSKPGALCLRLGKGGGVCVMSSLTSCCGVLTLVPPILGVSRPSPCISTASVDSAGGRGLAQEGRGLLF